MGEKTNKTKEILRKGTMSMVSLKEYDQNVHDITNNFHVTRVEIIKFLGISKGIFGKYISYRPVRLGDFIRIQVGVAELLNLLKDGNYDSK